MGHTQALMDLGICKIFCNCIFRCFRLILQENDVWSFEYVLLARKNNRCTKRILSVMVVQWVKRRCHFRKRLSNIMGYITINHNDVCYHSNDTPLQDSRPTLPPKVLAPFQQAIQLDRVGNTRRISCTWTLCKRELNESFRCERRRQGYLDEETKRDLVSPESAMFCTHLSHFGYAVQLLPERGFSYRACDEEMPRKGT